MPPSCRAVFSALTALASEDRSVKTTISELSRVTRFSRRQVRRALNRLHAANLIRWCGAGRGRGATGVVELRWVSFPQEKWASKSQADYPVRERTSEALCSGNKYITEEPSRLKSNQSSSLNQKKGGSSPPTHQTVADRPLWADGPAWCTRRVWAAIAGQVRRRSGELWGPHYGATATDAILATAARAARGGLLQSEDELRDLIRLLGGRLRESGHAIEILRDRPRAFAYLGAAARRWLRRRGKLEEPAPGSVSATDWRKWQEAAFEVLEELSWTWERRARPLDGVAPIVGKARKAWLETPPDRLHRRAWELLESLGWRFELWEARWIVLAALAAALGVRMPEPPRRDPHDGTPEQQARHLLSAIAFCGGGDFS